MADVIITANGSGDGTLINAAMAATTAGDRIIFRNGNYSIDTTVLFPKSLMWEGESDDRVIFAPIQGFAAAPTVYSNAINDISIAGLVINGDGLSATNESTGIQLRNADNIAMSNLTLKDFRGHQLQVYGCHGVDVDNLITSCADGIIGISHGVDIDGAFYSPVNLSYVGTTCTALLGAGHVVRTGDIITVQNAIGQANYNGSWEVIAHDATTVTFVVTSAPTGNTTGGVGRDTTGLVIVDSLFNNNWSGAGRQSFKASCISASSVTDSTFNSQVVLGTSEMAMTCGVLLDNCAINADVNVYQRHTRVSPEIRSSVFSRNRGVIRVVQDVGSNLISTNNTFHGRNSIVGHNNTTWIPVTKLTETGTYHPGKAPEAGKTVFASYNSTGSTYNVAPYITPDTARNNLEDLVEDVNLDETGIHYALLSDRGDNVVDASDSNILFQAVKCFTEGYPGKAVVNLVNRTTGDFISSSEFVAGSAIRKLQFKNANAAGVQAIRFQGLTSAIQGTIDDCIFEDITSAVAGGALEVQSEATVGRTANIAVRNCEFRRVTGGAVNGVVAYVQANTQAANVQFLGCKFDANVSTGATGLVRCNVAPSAITFSGCEFTNNATGSLGCFYNQSASSVVNNCTFHNNTIDINSTASIPIKNSIFQDITGKVTGAGAATLTNCMSAAAIIYDAATIDGGGNLSATAPTYTDAANGDYSLTPNSAGVSAGTNWWGTAPNPIGSDGEPFQDIKPDMGAIQNKHHWLHPSNI